MKLRGMSEGPHGRARGTAQRLAAVSRRSSKILRELCQRAWEDKLGSPQPPGEAARKISGPQPILTEDSMPGMAGCLPATVVTEDLPQKLVILHTGDPSARGLSISQAPDQPAALSGFGSGGWRRFVSRSLAGNVFHFSLTFLGFKKY